MAMVCTSITEWIEDEISKPIEQWEEERYEKCKKRPWWHPLRWLCWFVTRLVKVIRWIVVTVVTAVVTIVCHAIADLLSIFLDLLIGIGLLLAALFTWDKCALQSALGHLGNALGGALTIVGDVLVRPIIQRIQLYRLSNYVEWQIDQRYGSQPKVADALKERFNVNYGSFGYRLTCRLYRMYVDSATESPREPGVANLFALHRDGLINLYELAGFDRDCAIFSKKGWYQPRPQALIFPFVPVGGSVQRLSRNQLTAYIESAGVRGPRFRIFSISSSKLGMRERVASEKGRQLGLKIDFRRDDKEVTDPQFINYNRTPINPATPEPLVDCATKNKGQTDFLICELGRHPKSDFKCCTYGQQDQMITGSLDQARADLCSPAAIAVFGFTDKTTRGLASNLIGTSHCGDRDLRASMASGVSFIDDIPDEIRKYVLIHELGHYYGLCHVDGFDRMMVPGTDEGSLWTWKAPFNTLVHGGPRFIFRESQRVWDFILTNFPLSCFGLEDDIIL
jgi:hypothetical protein